MNVFSTLRGIMAKRHGTMLVALCGSVFVSASLFAVVEKSRARRLRKKKVEEKNEKELEIKQRRWQLLSIVWPRYSTSSLIASVLTLGLCARLYVSVKVSRMTGTLGACLVARDWSGLLDNQIRFALLCIPAAAINSAISFLRDYLSLSIRERLVNKSQKLLTSAVNNSEGVDVTWKSVEDPVSGRCSLVKVKSVVQFPDACLTSGAIKLSSELSELFLDFVKPLLEVVGLTYVLASQMGASELAKFYGVAFGLGIWTRKIVPCIKSGSSTSEAREDEFKSQHFQLMQHAEEFDLLGGGKTEKRILKRTFDACLEAKRSLLNQCFIGDCISNYFLRYLVIVAAVQCMAPALHTSVEPLSAVNQQAATEYFLGVLHELVHVGMALKNFAGGLRRMGVVKSLLETQSSLMNALENSRVGLLNTTDSSAIYKESNTDAVVKMDHVSIYPPSIASMTNEVSDTTTASTGGTSIQSDINSNSNLAKKSDQNTKNILVENISFSLSKGQNLLIRGANGTGKSTIIRVLRGITKPSHGVIYIPPPGSNACFCLPQTPYILDGGFATLRDNISYPTLAKHDDETDEKCMQLLRSVGLSDWLNRVVYEKVHNDDVKPSLKSILDSTGLCTHMSRGEQQRLCIARMKFNIESAQILLLDEIVNACPSDFGTEMYKHVCNDPNISVIAISHQKNIVELFDTVLTLTGDGRWDISK